VRLVKYTSEPLVFDHEYEYHDHEIASMVGKPRGLWLSDEDEFGWREWCEGEEWNLGGLAYATEFALTPEGNVLIITTEQEFKAFGEKYKGALYEGVQINGIDWRKVQADYDGIIITPYRHESRFDFTNFWYAGWDVASGCIWNLRAIVPVQRCGRVQNHGSITVTCAEPAGHDEAEGRGRVHRGESYGVKVMWLSGEPPERVEVPLIPGGYTHTSVLAPDANLG